MENKQPQQQNPSSTPPSALQQRVLDCIGKECLQPTPRYIFTARNWLIWCTWILSIVFGALAVAVIIFASMHASFSLYEATHDSRFAALLEFIPLVWFVIFATTGWLAYRQFRNTRYGYKYSLMFVLGSSVFISSVGGIALHVAGLDYQIDTYLGRVSPMYESYEEMEQKLWQQPDQGRLIGSLVTSTTTRTRFTDIHGVTWVLVLQEIQSADHTFLESGKLVRILGMQQASTTPTMYVCGVFPWMYDQSYALIDMKKDREAFVERMYTHRENYKERLAFAEEIAFSASSSAATDGMSKCGTIMPAKRVEEGM